METARHLVGALVELTTGMEHGHNHLKGALVHLLVLIDRDTTSVILHGDRVVFVDSYFDMRTKASHRLVARVVDGLVDQMVKTLLADVANIHGGALTYGFQTLEYLNVARGIILFLNQLFFCHFLLFAHFVCKGTKKNSDKHSLSAKKLQKITAAPKGCGFFVYFPKLYS